MSDRNDGISGVNSKRATQVAARGQEEPVQQIVHSSADEALANVWSSLGKAGSIDKPSASEIEAFWAAGITPSLLRKGWLATSALDSDFLRALGSDLKALVWTGSVSAKEIVEALQKKRATNGVKEGSFVFFKSELLSHPDNPRFVNDYQYKLEQMTSAQRRALQWVPDGFQMVPDSDSSADRPDNVLRFANAKIRDQGHQNDYYYDIYANGAVFRNAGKQGYSAPVLEDVMNYFVNAEEFGQEPGYIYPVHYRKIGKRLNVYDPENRAVTRREIENMRPVDDRP